MSKSLARRFCRCIKNVKKTVRLRRGLPKNKEGAAIAICTKSLLYPKGLTMKKLKCRPRPSLRTQKRLP